MRTHQNILLSVLLVAVIFMVTGDIYAATIYVSQNAVAAGAKSPKTIQAAVNQAQPGDTIIVNPGSYKEAVTLRSSGKTGAVITLKTKGKVIIDRRGLGGKGIVGRDIGFWIIDGFEIIGAAQAIKFKNAHDLTILNCRMSGGGTGFSLEGTVAKNIRLENCIAEKNIQGGFEIANPVATEKILFLKCRALYNDCKGGADGFGISHHATTKNVRFESCVAAFNGSDGFDLSGKKGFGITVVSCVAHDNGTKMWGANFKCWNPGSVFINCVAWRTGKSADANFAAYADKISFYNCTSGENADAGFVIGGKGATLVNCIIARAKKNALFNKHPDQKVIMKNSLFFANGSVANMPIGKDGNQEGDPKFIDWEKGKYGIQVDGAATQKGQPVKDVTVDIRGNPRPAQKPTVGAFEPRREMTGKK